MRRSMPTLALLLLVAAPLGAQTRDWVAPARYEHLVPRVGGEPGRVFSNLRYESNNRSMRGDFDPRAESGAENARRQQAIAGRIRGLFVLRDALFSQQDHPVEHQAFALMMPANWVTAAVADTMAGTPLRPVRAPALDDDAAWAAIPDAATMFGSFQPSDRLFETARRARGAGTPAEQAETRNARHNVRVLAEEAGYMIADAPRGARAVAACGAERISRSDRAYFTEALRRERVITLSVENPNEHERRDENKGFSIWGRDVPAAALTLTRDAVLRRRLEDGELALERYDLTQPAERRRAVEVLEAIVPTGSTGHRVWVWVGGGIIEGTELVEDASDQLPTFQRELAAAAIAHDRVIVFNRPSFRLRGHTAELEATVDRFHRMGLPLSVNASSGALQRVFRR
ncbi:MAG: hypothetical protein H6719_34305 [Sandaracinaceae bacterium]|nr:hypothetical protein [Sandaracinaceae bacterium]